MPEETKGVLSSKTIWGGLIAVLPLVGEALEKLDVLPPGVFGESINILVSACGGLLAIYGRVKAHHKIKGVL